MISWAGMRRTAAMRAKRQLARAARRWASAALLLLTALPACDEPCCTVDSHPIQLQRGPSGELLVRIRADGDPDLAVLDTGTPVTLWNTGDPTVPTRVVRRDLRLLGPAVPDNQAPTRALLRGVLTIEASLGALTAVDQRPLRPRAIVGGDLLTLFSVEIDFTQPAVTFWDHQPSGDSFLAAAGYAVLHLPRRGGGQLVVLDPTDSIGQSPPHRFPPSRMLVRACAAAKPFDREEPLPQSCCASNERRLSTGADLSLLIATGVGPLVLGRAAWQRILSHLPPGTNPVLVQRPLSVANFDQPIPAAFTRLPGLALVDREADLGGDPGPCAELARSRRLEQVALSQSRNADRAACAFPCDLDPKDTSRAQNSAAYLQLDGDLEVAIIDDTTALLQSVRTEVRPSGPEVDGLLGAAALARVRVELDYVGSQPRGIFSCDSGTPTSPATTPAPSCRAVARCPRLPGKGPRRTCFGLPAHGLPNICENVGACDE